MIATDFLCLGTAASFFATGLAASNTGSVPQKSDISLPGGMWKSTPTRLSWRTRASSRMPPCLRISARLRNSSVALTSATAALSLRSILRPSSASICSSTAKPLRCRNSTRLSQSSIKEAIRDKAADCTSFSVSLSSLRNVARPPIRLKHATQFESDIQFAKALAMSFLKSDGLSSSMASRHASNVGRTVIKDGTMNASVDNNSNAEAASDARSTDPVAMMSTALATVHVLFAVSKGDSEITGCVPSSASLFFFFNPSVEIEPRRSPRGDPGRLEGRLRGATISFPVNEGLRLVAGLLFGFPVAFGVFGLDASPCNATSSVEAISDYGIQSSCENCETTAAAYSWQ
mmetsp:Transcript_32905/g.53396  ORF Transcript_32905/g.53396 Transcript_32905/m.53396 type:complete len:346 (-) Transcript_32905:18-1055(-)